MKIHEYQAKSVLARFGVAVPRGEVAFSSQEAGEIARRLGGNIAVVKAQIHAGGRGKGGGVKIAKTPDEAFETTTPRFRFESGYDCSSARATPVSTACAC